MVLVYLGNVGQHKIIEVFRCEADFEFYCILKKTLFLSRGFDASFGPSNEDVCQLEAGIVSRITVGIDTSCGA
jgi:hypothetical protein